MIFQKALPAIMNTLLRLVLFICLVFAGQSYATTAVAYGYGVDTSQAGLGNLNNNGLINPSGCCSNSSSRDSQDRAPARAFFALAAVFDVAKGTAADLPFDPRGTAGAAKAWTSIKGRLKAAQLPTTGKIRFVPPKGYTPSNPLAKGPNGGYLDRFGNEWVKGPSRTQGQAFEWDVQLSKTGQSKLGWATRDGSHANVSLDGRITHK